MSMLMVMAGVGAVGSIVGATVSAIGASESAKREQALDNYNAAVARNNAAEIKNAGEQAAKKKTAEGEALISRQRALYAVAGVTSSGTPTEVMIGTAEEAASDAWEIEQNSAFKSQQETEQSKLDEMAGQNASAAASGIIGGTLLTGLAKAFSSMEGAYKPKGSGNIK